MKVSHPLTPWVISHVPNCKDLKTLNTRASPVNPTAERSSNPFQTPCNKRKHHPSLSLFLSSAVLQRSSKQEHRRYPKKRGRVVSWHGSICVLLGISLSLTHSTEKVQPNQGTQSETDRWMHHCDRKKSDILIPTSWFGESALTRISLSSTKWYKFCTPSDYWED